MENLNGVNGDGLVFGGENIELGVYAGKTMSINNNFTGVNGTDLVIGGTNNGANVEIGANFAGKLLHGNTVFSNASDTVNLGSAGSPTDLSNGAVASVRIDQPTPVTDGRDTSFVVTPANHEVSSSGDAANADDNSLGNDGPRVIWVIMGAIGGSRNSYLALDHLGEDYENFIKEIMGNNAPNDTDTNGG